MRTGDSAGVPPPSIRYTVSSEEVGTREGGPQTMLGKLPSNLVISLCIALLVGILLLLGNITAAYSSQTGIMLVAPPYHFAFT
jgi:hypothetical protein